jgi:hypothetical protein
MCALQSSRPLPEYPCSQQDLYTIVETGWQSYAEFLADFMNLSTLYTAATGTDQLAALAAARAMPDEDSRNEVHKTLRVQLSGLAETCLITWSDMSTYIRDGFPANEYENKRIAAGANYYAGAAHENWDDVKGLMQNGIAFVNANTATLTTGGMPATFVADMTAARDAFEVKHQAFLHAEEDSKVLTDEKITANNALYRALTKMNEDGKKIFRNNAAVREQFTFERIWELVSGNGGGSGTGVPSTIIELGIYTYDEDTLEPIAGATFSVLNAPGNLVVSATTDSLGMTELKITGYAADEDAVLEVELVAPGYETASGTMDMRAGNYYSLDFGMVPLVVP